MYDPEILLTSPAFLEKVCAHVIDGASPHMAARFEGMKERDYWRFWEEGKKADEKPEQERTERDEFLARFVDRIELALAEARIDAEKRVFEKNPSAYLRYGSGREGGAEKRGWESGIDYQKNLFASNPLAYLLRGPGKPPPDGYVKWRKDRNGKWVSEFTPEGESPTAKFFEYHCGGGKEKAEKERQEKQAALDAKTQKFFEELFGKKEENPPPADSSPHPSASGALPSPHQRRGDENSELPLSVDTERGLGGEVSSREVGLKGPGP